MHVSLLVRLRQPAGSKNLVPNGLPTLPWYHNVLCLLPTCHHSSTATPSRSTTITPKLHQHSSVLHICTPLCTRGVSIRRHQHYSMFSRHCNLPWPWSLRMVGLFVPSYMTTPLTRSFRMGSLHMVGSFVPSYTTTGRLLQVNRLLYRMNDVAPNALLLQVFILRLHCSETKCPIASILASLLRFDSTAPIDRIAPSERRFSESCCHFRSLSCCHFRSLFQLM